MKGPRLLMKQLQISLLNNLRVPVYCTEDSLKKPAAKQQKFGSFKVERPHLLSLDGHGKSVSTPSRCCWHTNDASLQITMSKWASERSERGMLSTLWHILCTQCPRFPPYVTWLFVHNKQRQKRKRKKGRKHVHCSVSQVFAGPMHCKGLLSQQCEIQERECWVKLPSRL